MIEFLCKGKKGKNFRYIVNSADIIDVVELSTGNALITLTWRLFRHRNYLETAESYEDVKNRIEKIYPIEQKDDKYNYLEKIILK